MPVVEVSRASKSDRRSSCCMPKVEVSRALRASEGALVLSPLWGFRGFEERQKELLMYANCGVFRGFKEL
jgi:hypothetical protein